MQTAVMHLLKRTYQRIIAWDHWPDSILFAPVVIHLLILATKAKSLMFFSATNPGMHLGGLNSDPKSNTLSQIPPQYTPETIVIRPSEQSSDDMLSALEKTSLTYPIVCKPDAGCRGQSVKKIKNKKELITYYKQAHQENFLIQECITHEVEVSVMFIHLPWEEKGNISFIAIKHPLKLIGDGKSTLVQLVEKSVASKKLQKKILAEHPHASQLVLKKDAIMQPSFTYNHSTGAQVLECNECITTASTAAFRKISGSISGFHLGRYDVRVKSLEDLKKGKTIKVLEVNGVVGEPHYFYDPKYNLLDFYKITFNHWKTIYDIAKYNNKTHGIPYAPTKELMGALKKYSG